MGLLHSTKAKILSIFLVQILIGYHPSNGRCHLPAKVHATCPAGWNQRGTNCFKPIGQFTWHRARQECEVIGGIMATPHSREEGAYLQQLTSSEPWINCNDLELEGNWVCIDGPADINNYWVSGEPSNSNGRQHCAKIWSQGWDDVKCDGTFPAVCKQPVHLQ